MGGRTCSGPLSDPPGGLFPRICVDPQQYPQESATDLKIRLESVAWGPQAKMLLHFGNEERESQASPGNESAADPPQVHSGAVDFLFMIQPKKFRRSTERVSSVGGQESECPQRIRSGFAANFWSAQ